MYHRYLIIEYSQFLTLIPCDIIVIYFNYPYTIIIKYFAII